LRRVWFKKEMREAILTGRKTATTRDHPLPLEKVQAVGGSRYKAQVFAILEITDRLPVIWRDVIRMFYHEEGFSSSDEMQSYALKHGLTQNLKRPMFFHRFKLAEAA